MRNGLGILALAWLTACSPNVIGLVVHDVKVAGPNKLIIERCKLQLRPWFGMEIATEDCLHDKIDVAAGTFEPSAATPPK